MTPSIEDQLIIAASWAEQEAAAERDRAPDSEPGYDLTAKPLRWLARRAAAGDIDLSRLAPPSPTESAWSGLLARLKRIGIDVWEMTGRPEVRT